MLIVCRPWKKWIAQQTGRLTAMQIRSSPDDPHQLSDRVNKDRRFANWCVESTARPEKPSRIRHRRYPPPRPAGSPFGPAVLSRVVCEQSRPLLSDLRNLAILVQRCFETRHPRASRSIRPCAPTPAPPARGRRSPQPSCTARSPPSNRPGPPRRAGPP